MEGEDMAEKTLVHKTAVKRISTHWDQENVKKYVLPRTPLPTWSLLQKINTATLQVSGNLVTENKLSYLDPWTLIKKKKISEFYCSDTNEAQETMQKVSWPFC